jgi:hypothetical protein
MLEHILGETVTTFEQEPTGQLRHILARRDPIIE